MQNVKVNTLSAILSGRLSVVEAVSGKLFPKYNQNQNQKHFFDP